MNSHFIIPQSQKSIEVFGDVSVYNGRDSGA